MSSADIRFFGHNSECQEPLYRDKKSENHEKCQKSLFSHPNDHISRLVEQYMPSNPILPMVTFTDTHLANIDTHEKYIYIYIYYYNRYIPGYDGDRKSVV